MEKPNGQPKKPKAFTWKWALRTGLVVAAWSGGYYHGSHPDFLNEEVSSIGQNLSSRRLIREESFGKVDGKPVEVAHELGPEPEEIAGEPSEAVCEGRAGEALGSLDADLTVKDVAFGLAVAVVSFFVLGLSLLCTVKYPDKDIRRYVWRMISSTLSVCMALSINAALIHFVIKVTVLYLELGLQYNGISKVLMHAAWSFVIFVIFLVLLEFFAWRMQDNTEYRYAFNTILGHCAGIAGITMFGSLQELWDMLPRTSHLPFLPVALVLIAVLCFTQHYARQRLCCQSSQTTYQELRSEEETPALQNAQPQQHGHRPFARAGAQQHQVGHQPPAVEGEEDWIVEVSQATDEVYVLILSFILSQIIIWIVTGIHPSVHLRLHFEEHPPTKAQISWMGLPITLSMLALLMLTISENRVYRILGGLPPKQLRGKPEIEENNAYRWRTRWAPVLQTMLAMVMSWCVLRSGQWLVRAWAESSSKTNFRLPTMIVIITAFLLSFISWVVIVILDQVADYAAIQAERHYRSETANGEDQQSDTEQSIEEVSDEAWRQEETIGGLHRSIPKHFDSGVRWVADGFGLLMGMCWERAADAAVEAIIEDVPMFCTHPVFFRVAVAFLCTCCISYPWFRYIVPIAKKEPYEHEADMELEGVQQSSRQWRVTAEDKRKAIINKFIRIYKGLREKPETLKGVCMVSLPVPLDEHKWRGINLHQLVKEYLPDYPWQPQDTRQQPEIESRHPRRQAPSLQPEESQEGSPSRTPAWVPAPAVWFQLQPEESPKVRQAEPASPEASDEDLPRVLGRHGTHASTLTPHSETVLKPSFGNQRSLSREVPADAIESS